MWRALPLLLIGACAKDPGPDTGPEGLEPGSFDITGVVTEAFAFAPVEGVEVCVLEAPRVGCTTTAANGTYALDGLPDEAHVHVSYTKDGHVRYLWATDTATAEDQWLVALPTDVEYADWAEVLGLQWNKRLGGVSFKAVDAAIGGVPGTVVNLREAQHDGPVYLANNAPSATATATDDSGLGQLVNVAIGTWDLVYEPPDGKTCTPRWGWAGSEPNSIEVQVFEDQTTIVEMLCT